MPSTKGERGDLPPTSLTEDELARISGGATEELKGSHNFLLEVAGITPEKRTGRRSGLSDRRIA